MLGWLLLGALLTATVIVIAVSYLDKAVAKRKLKEKNIKKAVIKDIVNNSGVAVIKLDAIDDYGDNLSVEFETEDYDSYDIKRGATIYI